MRTGKVAKSLGVDPKTVRDWTDKDEFQQFFSDSAKGEDVTQRDYTDVDLVVLNTVRALRANNDSWDDIAAKLESGYRDTELPASALLVADAAPIEQYAKRMQIQAELEVAKQRVELLEGQIDKLQSAHADEREQMRQEHAEERERLQKRIEELSQEVGKWKAYYEIASKDDD